MNQAPRVGAVRIDNADRAVGADKRHGLAAASQRKGDRRLARFAQFKRASEPNVRSIPTLRNSLIVDDDKVAVVAYRDSYRMVDTQPGFRAATQLPPLQPPGEFTKILFTRCGNMGAK